MTHDFIQETGEDIADPVVVLLRQLKILFSLTASSSSFPGDTLLTIRTPSSQRSSYENSKSRSDWSLLTREEEILADEKTQEYTSLLSRAALLVRSCRTHSRCSGTARM